MQSAVRPVSVGPRTTRYFSAPGFNVGVRTTPSAAAGPAPRPRPPPPNAYTPEKSGLPSGVRGIPLAVGAAEVGTAEVGTAEVGTAEVGRADAAGAAAGFVPATVTVTDLLMTVSFGPRIVRV